MSIASYIREIGRGKEGARSLDSQQAHDLMTQVLDGQASDLEVGAFAVAMRIKGESLDELCGFVHAVRERCIPIGCNQSAVILPSYNGARKLPNLTALLALLLAQEGVPVLVHGPADEPGRIATSSIFHDLGLATAHTGSEVQDAWARHEPAFMTTESLCPPLARLLAVRRVIGLRNPGHTVAKLLDPISGADALRVVNHTHPEYAISLTEFLKASMANAMLLRGTEGEPVADPRRLPRLDVFVRGALRADLSVQAQEGVLTELPVLPRSIDAATTAVYIQSVVSGEKPALAPLGRQVDCILSALRAMQTAPVHELSA
jgi:anthranilate phosphoribosyltransferase